LTPSARIPDPGLRASLAVRPAHDGGPLPGPAIFPDFITLIATVARDELRKDGGKEANRVLRADRTGQPRRQGSESWNPVRVFSTANPIQ
jgi:hypothetical protein